MNSKEIASSIPYTIQNYDNYLKDYVNTSGFQWDSKCLDVSFRNLGNNFEKYVQKIGEFNTVAATNPQYTPPRSYQEKDYDKPCPKDWTQSGGGCINYNYDGKCNAGQTKQEKRNPVCPSNNSGQSVIYNSYTVSVPKYTRYWFFGWRNWFRGYELEQRWYSYNNPNFYNGWSGPIDYGWWSTCNANVDYSRSNSLNKSQEDCRNSGNYPSGTTCWMQPKYNNRTFPPSYFNGYSNQQKTDWENECNAEWPMRTINIPGKWTCEYGENIYDDIGRGYLIQLPVSVNSIIEAAKIALQSNKMIDNYFAIIDNNLYIIGQNSNIGIITSKGAYQPNCIEKNNKKIDLYLINQEFFNMLQNCKIVNDKINDVNINRDILQNAISSIKENFSVDSNINNEEIIKNQNEILANLTSNYNKKAELYNYQIDLLGNNEKMVEDNNKKLNKQLNDLSLIQNQIALKDRVIELNDELTKKQIRNKKILIGFFVLIPFLAIPILLIFTKSLGSFTGLSLVGLMIIGYIIYMFVIANQSDVKKFGREDKRIITKYEKSITNFWNKQKKALSDYISEKCQDEENNYINDENETGSGSGSGSRGSIYPKGEYLIKSNGPFYYYDGSAPPQQIYPAATGSIEFSIEGENYKFPKDVQNILKKIKNPITQFFFYTWMNILTRNGIKVDDPRFAQDLNVIDFSDSDQTPMPFWDNIKLPIVTNVDKQFNYLFQSYSREKKNISQTASVLLVDLWNFIFGDKIPGDIYQVWVNKLAIEVKKQNPNIEQFYEDYLNELIKLPKFSEKYGEGDKGLMKFAEIKMVDFIKTFNNDIHVSQPFSKKIDP
jgi:hypothetical protein